MRPMICQVLVGEAPVWRRRRVLGLSEEDLAEKWTRTSFQATNAGYTKLPRGTGVVSVRVKAEGPGGETTTERVELRYVFMLLKLRLFFNLHSSTTSRSMYNVM